MPALNPNDYAYLWNPTNQFLDRNGKPLVGGYVMVNIAGTSGVVAQTYSDWNGTENANKIYLDSLGRANCIVAVDSRYDMYVYNKYNGLEYSALNIAGTGGEGGDNLKFTSSDGSITIVRTGNRVDLTVHANDSMFGALHGAGKNADDSINLTTTSAGNITVQNGLVSLEDGKLYHVTLELEFENSTPAGSYVDCSVTDSFGSVHKFSLDESRTVEYVNLSWDINATDDTVKFIIDIPQSYNIEAATAYIHMVNSISTGGSIEVDNELSLESENPVQNKVVTAAINAKADTADLATVAFSGNYNDLSNTPVIPTQVQSNWNETDSADPSYIQNKPTIPAAQVNSDWNASTGVAQILNKPNLATVATSGSYNDLTDKPTIPTVPVQDVEVDGTSVVNSQGVAEIDLTDYAKKSEVPAAQEQANWTETDTSDPSYIKNKPSLATVATSGSYNDLSNKPSIPAAQVNSDWNASSGVAEILNKPSLATVATSGSYNDLSNKPSIPAAQVNSDWDAASGVAQILNKPSIKPLTAGHNITVTESASAVTIAATDELPASTSGDSGKVLTVNSSGNPAWITPSTPASASVEFVDFNSYSSNPSGAATVITNAINAGKKVILVVPASIGGNSGAIEVELAYYLNDMSVFCFADVGDPSTVISKTLKYENSTWSWLSNVYKQVVPMSASGDSGKVLTIDSNGKPIWQAPGSFTQAQADWTETDTTAASYIQHKPSLATVATSGSYNDLSNTPSIPSATSDLTNDSGFITASDVPSAQEQADWNEADSNDPAYIKNKPVIPAAQVNADWNATSGVAEILNKPTIPAAQVNSDWNASSGVAEILNKPVTKTLVAGTNVTLTETSSDITISASGGSFTQVQADWTETDNTDPSYIQNKPSLATVATTGSYTDLSNTPTIPDGVPTVTSSDDGKVLTADYTGGVASYSWETAPSGSTGLFEAEYGTTTYSDIITAITNKNVVYCKISSGATGAYRMAAMAYYDGTSVEFHYYRSLNPNNTGSDEVYVYAVDVNSNWTTTSRNINASLFEAVYGTTTFSEIGNAYASGKIVYCSVPTGTTGNYRKAYLSYKTSGQCQFTYYRSNNNGDSVFIYTVTSSGWTTTENPLHISVNQVPAVTSSDNGKVLKASYSGGTGSYSWQTESGGGGTVDQTYDPTSTNAQSGTAVAGAIATVNQVPSSTSADEGKVLTVDANGDPEWATGGGTQQQADWTQTDSTAVDYIKNKPSLATVATSGSYNDLSNTPTIPTVPTAGNMLSVTNDVLNVTTTAGITDVQVVSALPASTVPTVLYLIPET